MLHLLLAAFTLIGAPHPRYALTNHIERAGDFSIQASKISPSVRHPNDPRIALWCAAANDPTSSNRCGQTVIYVRADLICFFSDDVVPVASHDGNYYGNAGLDVIGWPYMDTAGGRLWYIYWVNIMNQPLAQYGPVLYADVSCISKSSSTKT